MNFKKNYTLLIFVFIAFLCTFCTSARISLTGIKTGVCQDLAAVNSTDVDSIIRLMANAGVSYVRLPFKWANIETAKGVFTWSKYDDLVDKLIANNIEIDGQIGVVPSWANGKTYQNVPTGQVATSYPPINVQDFYDFVKVAAERYKTKIRYWTMRNEPNITTFWAPAPNIEEYTQNLKAGYEAVKSVDPEIKVIGGTIAGNGVFMGWETEEQRNFLQKMCDSKATDYCDIISIHPYNDPSKGIAALQIYVDVALNVLKINNINKPLWIDEIGWSTVSVDGSPLATEDEIAAWLTEVFSKLKRVDRILWYNFKDAKYNPTDKEQNFGVVDYKLAPKPAYYALKKFNEIMVE